MKLILALWGAVSPGRAPPPHQIDKQHGYFLPKRRQTAEQQSLRLCSPPHRCGGFVFLLHQIQICQIP